MYIYRVYLFLRPRSRGVLRGSSPDRAKRPVGSSLDGLGPKLPKKAQSLRGNAALGRPGAEGLMGAGRISAVFQSARTSVVELTLNAGVLVDGDGWDLRALESDGAAAVRRGPIPGHEKMPAAAAQPAQLFFGGRVHGPHASVPHSGPRQAAQRLTPLSLWTAARAAKMRIPKRHRQWLSRLH